MPTNAKPLVAEGPAPKRVVGEARATGQPFLIEGAILPAAPILVKRTITVDQRGPALQETTLNERSATETHEEAKADSMAESEHKNAPAGLFGGLAALWPLLLIAVLGLAAWIGWGLLKKRLP